MRIDFEDASRREQRDVPRATVKLTKDMDYWSIALHYDGNSLYTGVGVENVRALRDVLNAILDRVEPSRHFCRAIMPGPYFGECRRPDGHDGAHANASMSWSPVTVYGKPIGPGGICGQPLPPAAGWPTQYCIRSHGHAGACRTHT